LNFKHFDIKDALEESLDIEKGARGGSLTGLIGNITRKNKNYYKKFKTSNPNSQSQITHMIATTGVKEMLNGKNTKKGLDGGIKKVDKIIALMQGKVKEVKINLKKMEAKDKAESLNAKGEAAEVKKLKVRDERLIKEKEAHERAAVIETDKIKQASLMKAADEEKKKAAHAELKVQSIEKRASDQQKAAKDQLAAVQAEAAARGEREKAAKAAFSSAGGRKPAQEKAGAAKTGVAKAAAATGKPAATKAAAATGKPAATKAAASTGKPAATKAAAAVTKVQI
jgi:hypothetical protein